MRMNLDGDGKKDASLITPGKNINPPAESELETAKAEHDQEECEHSNSKLSVLVYRDHISRVLRTAARTSPDMGAVPDVSITSSEGTTDGVGKSGHLTPKFKILEARSGEEEVSSTTTPTASRESCEVGKKTCQPQTQDS